MESKGVDSFVGGIAIDSTDRVGFDIGPYSNPLSESEPIIYSRENFLANGWSDSSMFILVDDYRTVRDRDQYRKQNLLWDTVDGREEKNCLPEKGRARRHWRLPGQS